ncbi:MAG: hypothetical protein J0H02_00750, partial [Armatimonadetes bacterium]|nr:hypothetical protein [Armatimonadota bacterium]
MTAPLQSGFSFDEIDCALEPTAVLDAVQVLRPLPKVLRRSGMMVEWNTNRIEIAIRKAFLAQSFDSEPAVDVAAQVEQRVRATGQDHVDIEMVQDFVQEELMRSGHYKVAEAYIVYRARRAFLREQAPETAIAEESPFALVEAIDNNGQPFLWSGIDLRHRIEFARTGLSLAGSSVELEQELRRSLGANVSLSEIQKVVILNAKSLMERDSDFAFFAARILLTYIYEECLDWDIVHDGPASLKEFH